MPKKMLVFWVHKENCKKQTSKLDDKILSPNIKMLVLKTNVFLLESIESLRCTSGSLLKSAVSLELPWLKEYLRTTELVTISKI